MEPLAIKWEPINGILAPAWDFSFSCRPMRELSTFHLEILSAVVHFNEKLPNDLSLQFHSAVAIEQRPDWYLREGERCSNPLPRCGGQWPLSVFPLLRIESSVWLKSVAPDWSSVPRGLVHFAIYTSEKGLHIAAAPDINADWIAPLRVSS
jgi:hypothetical protein